ncbi:hypothetical protein EsH8_IV_000613 [Colletotrichum jinshuiense]
MTSTASPQSNPAPNSSAATSAPSYASAAGANKKQASTPLIATGSNPPVVVAGSSAQNAKPSAPSPVNGRPPITPAVPAAPAVAHGSSNMNGNAPDHARKSSVTLSANGPNSFAPNGGPVGGSKPGIQFGYNSPAVAHSTAQATAAPIPIPGSNQRVPSPAHSPSPIPQPSASGGRPPSGMAPSNAMTFGSLGSDGDRHMRQGSTPQTQAALPAQPGSHIRRESGVSQHSDVGGPAGSNQGPNRQGFQPQGGRGRGFNPHQPPYNANMGFPPNQQYRNGQGRGSMPPAFHPGRPMQPYPNSPQPTRSPALAQSQPGTPNMPPAQMHPMPMATPPQYHYPPPNMAQPQQQYGYPPQPTQYDQFGRPIYYNQMGYMPSPPGGPPAFQPGFVPPPYHQPAPTAMSRTSSHSERPSSSTGQPSQPVVVSGTPQPQNAQVKTPIVASSGTFVRPKKSAAIVIKNAAGEAVDFKSIKTPSSPAPSIQQSKTPPIVTSTPTPPPKSATPSHVRNDSQATPKTRQEIQDELRAKIQQAKGGEDKAKEEADAKAKAVEEEKKAAEAKAAEEKAAEAKAAEQKAAEQKAAEAKAAEAKAKADADEKAKEEARKAEEEAEAKRKAAEEEKAKAQAEAEAEAKAKAEAEKAAEPAADEEDEVERMIREMEEEDARREKAAAEYNAKKAAEKEAQKKADEANKATNAAEADRKLREAEREMERLEEERERKRAQGGSAPSVADLLSKSKSGDAADSEPAKVGDVADKLSNLSIGDSKASTPTEASAPRATPTEKRGPKPSPLNLAPLNTKPVEPPQPSAALQSLKSARFLTVMNQDLYPAGISSPNPALNAAVAKKGKTFKYDAQFLLQFQKVFTEQPSTEFHQQVKSLIGDNDGSRSAATPRAGSSRGGSQRGAVAANPMGSFRGPANQNVRGTTSAERFALSNAAMGSGGPVGGMGTFRSSFPVGSQMSRTPSSSNMGPNSPRTRSARGGGGSRRNDYNAKEAQAAKTMPLTAGMDLKPITVSATGWKPTSLGKSSAQAAPASDHMDPEMVQRKVKAALNKMTPEKFDKIADQILAIAGQSKDESDGRTLRQVIQLTFEKATDEAHWASMYAKFCKRMLDTMSPEIRDENIKDKNGVVVSGGALFRKYLLNRCQEEFERGWKVNLPNKPEEDEGKPQSTEATMLSDEYYIAAAAKRRGLGLVQFIGELYKLGMLTERIMHECVRKLVDYEGVPDEAEIESLSKLLRTIGSNLDASDKGKALMNVYFDRIQHMMDMPELASRLKFMLLDVIDLRKSGWASKEANKGPKTLDEIRAEAEAAALAKAQENQRGGSHRGGPGGRPNMGRGDSRNFSSGYMQAQSNQVGMDDLRRLKGSTNRAASGNISLGPTSMFASRSNSGRRLGPGGSLGRPGEDSGASSRTGTPPTTQHHNAFSALANLDNETPASPPSTAASPALSKAVPDSAAAGEAK